MRITQKLILLFAIIILPLTVISAEDKDKVYEFKDGEAALKFDYTRAAKKCNNIKFDKAKEGMFANCLCKDSKTIVKAKLDFSILLTCAYEAWGKGADKNTCWVKSSNGVLIAYYPQSGKEVLPKGENIGAACPAGRTK